jgi:kinesin family protein 18/19
MSEIFRCLKSLLADRDYEIRISFLEIYNENIRDLTEFTQGNGKIEHASQQNPDTYLDLREDPMKGVVVAGLNEIKVKSAQEI